MCEGKTSLSCRKLVCPTGKAVEWLQHTIPRGRVGGHNTLDAQHTAIVLSTPQFNVMARIGIVFGLVLFGLTIAALSITTQKTYTQFVPMMFGIPLLFCGIVALNPHRRGKAVLAALILAAIGLLFGVVRIIALGLAWLAGDSFNPLSFEMVALMSAICLVFVVIAERWRRRRTAEDNRVEAGRRHSGELLKCPTVVGTLSATPLAPPRGVNKNPYQTPAILNETTSPPPTDDPAK